MLNQQGQTLLEPQLCACGLFELSLQRLCHALKSEFLQLGDGLIVGHDSPPWRQ